jgi:hypothetical protein
MGWVINGNCQTLCWGLLECTLHHSIRTARDKEFEMLGHPGELAYESGQERVSELYILALIERVEHDHEWLDRA